MALNYHDVEYGLAIGGKSISLSGSGAPAGTQADNADPGALYHDYTNGTVYRKTAAGAGNWTSISSVDISWREPARILDDASYANLAAAETAMNAGAIQGVSLVANDRVLLTNVTGSDKNVYIVTGTPGAGATYVQDSNNETTGDQIYIIGGTYAGRTYYFDGTNWIWINQADADELGYVRTFIGKSGAGNETPDYSSNIHVTDATSLETAIGALDAVLGKAFVKTTATNVTTAVTLDSVLVDDVEAVKWLVSARGNLAANDEKKKAVEIWAVHDGSTGSDATSADYTVYATVKHGTLTGLTFTVDVNGTGAAQTMRLRVSSTMAVDVRAVRTIVDF